MLPCICSVIDHRRCQNVVRTSAHCASFYHMWFVIYSRQKKLTLARLPRANKFWSWANKIEVQWLSGRVKLDSVVLWVWIKMSACQMSKLKMLHGKKLTALFPWDFKSVFVWHITCKILSFEFYPKAVFFECKFRISRSAIVQVQNWPIRLQRVGSRIRWCPRLTSLKLQRVNAAYCTCKTGL